MYTGGNYIYPSNFAWLLRHLYEDTRKAGLTGLTFVSGGVFGHDLRGAFSSGSDYITETYNQGLAHAGWRSVKQAHGSYPVDAIGQHLYIDQARATSSRKITKYLNAVRNAYVAFEGSATTKTTVITEVGWTTASVNQRNQADNLKLAYSVFKKTTYVKNAYWFNIQDVPEAKLSFGLQTSGSDSDMSSLIKSYPSISLEVSQSRTPRCFNIYWLKSLSTPVDLVRLKARLLLLVL